MITKPEEEPGMVNQATEDAIKLKTLGQLAESPNFDIREAAIGMVRERVFRDGPAWDLLLQHLASSQPSYRNKALTSLIFLMKRPRRPLTQIKDNLFAGVPFLTALVACLHSFLPEACAAVEDDTYPSEYQVFALQILDTVLRDDLPKKILERNIRTALDAGLVSRWLVHYPFCAGTGTVAITMQQRRDVIGELLRNDPYTNYHPIEISYILRVLTSNTYASKALKRYGLLVRSIECEDCETCQRRHVEESPEELQLRRRRREAMVLGEEGREVRRSDIFQRSDDIRDEDVEEELQELLEEVAQAEGRGEGGVGGYWDVVRRLRPGGLAPA
ncbi:MAG: hypothetical protein Q9163_000567 [Psora crenata]